MSNYATGHEAERVAASYLENLGYKILDINWKTPRCEIDIVAMKDTVVHCIEVKYRKNDTQGSGFDYITPKKQLQMAFAAEVWVMEHHWSGQYVLGAIELEGADYHVRQFLEQI